MLYDEKLLFESVISKKIIIIIIFVQDPRVVYTSLIIGDIGF